MPSYPPTSPQPRLPRRQSHAQITPTKPPLRRSLSKHGESIRAAPIVEDSRDSLSSNGSWIRRLSIRPLSQHGSLRSSFGPDSPSIFSFGSSTAPIISHSRDAPPQLPPNKLVKRAPGTSSGDSGFLTRRGSRRTQVTLRRPATSHQRSATLHHQIDPESLPPLPKFSLEQQKRPRAKTLGVPHQQAAASDKTKVGDSRWKSFWHARISFGITKNSPLRGSDGHNNPVTKRINIEQEPTGQAYLVAPATIIMNENKNTGQAAAPQQESPTHPNTEHSPQSSDNYSGVIDVTPSKQPKRSLSMQFGSPTSWISKTGSIRLRKKGSDATTGKRNVSAPMSGDSQAVSTNDGNHNENASDGAEVTQAEADLAAIFHPPDVKQDLSAPNLPRSRISSFQLDLNRLASSSPPVSPGRSEEAKIPLATGSRVNSNGSRTRTLERASTVGSSEYHRGFMSGDDDDTDFKTDTPFDSFRTVASSRKKNLDNPLESMFDDSPPSTAIGNKPKRLSIQEILGPTFDGDNKILEEDESGSTPVRGTFEEFEARFHAASIVDDGRPLQLSLNRNYPLDIDKNSQLSLDDDDDEAWAKEGEMEIYNHLSPPSSMNSRRGSPYARAALGGMNGNSKSDSRLSSSERPRSTVFDWTEPAAHDKREKNGLEHRPKTVHGKQEMDMRGGRSSNRKTFVPNHVRSQSVPVVPDPNETAKSAPKFGTWGLGQKNVSEDWDDDFDFDEDQDFGGTLETTGKKDDKRVSMIVPASIQATQPTVKAHSGQIRELSLLVNDLKRLCRLGREMDMVNGTSTKFWLEAEGIIALASPDEDTPESDDIKTLEEFDMGATGEQHLEQGFGGSFLDGFESPSKRTSVDQPHRRRQSVFSLEDDIFGTWDHADKGAVASNRPHTPENPVSEPRSTSVARSVMESMRVRRSTSPDDEGMDEAEQHPKARFNFDTNSLKELVKRAGDLRDSLSEIIRRADHITQSPVRTPKHTRPDGSPAFTRVFDEPTTSPTRRNPPNLSNTPSTRGGASATASPSNGVNRRLQMMTVN
ncbi:hypothetical protein F5Y16DRAFT_382607 [Xylariaceae sp. FL0255]|nr:hypothetical protein F5Y16DRAFT_382607 [Xylariaceae sp. FL0255]